MTGHHKHRSGALKQTNKLHKTGRHRSKGNINTATKGKSNVQALTTHTSKVLSKEVRRNQCQQMRKKKRAEVIAQKRNFGSSSAPPILITVIPLHQNIDTHTIVSMITRADNGFTVITNNQGITHISVPRFKQRYSIIIPPLGNTFATLDATKVTTTILFIMSATNVLSDDEMIDTWGKEILEASIAQGLPSVIVGLSDLETVNVKKRHDIKHLSQSLIDKWLPGEKVLTLNNSADALNVLRKAGCQKQRIVAHRDRRPHMLAEDIQYSSDDDHMGTMKVSGYLRGMPLSVNSIVHIPGFGNFHMLQIDAPGDPYPITHSDRGGATNITDGKIEQQIRILDKADPKKQESLESENTPDSMDAEQTWPTEEEITRANQEQLQKKATKLVPKGTSEYQAAWIVDENSEFSDHDCSDEENEDDERMSIVEATSDTDDSHLVNDDENEEYETLTVSEAAIDDNRYDDQMDIYEERETMKKLRDAKVDAHFPDEVDTPEDVMAKIRFQKYRGLESFRTSPWDPKENLPYDYSRIFQFENYERTRKRIFKENEEIDGASPGWYITLHINNVRRSLFEAFSTLEKRPLVLCGLLPNEHRMSLLNIVLKRKIDMDAEPIKSKETLIFQCGFRRFSACPIFSEHTTGTKHKYARFFQPNDTLVASMYAPITFSPCRVICYKKNNHGLLELVATGSVLSADPNRLVIKRAILSGHPFKVNKRSAVIRFMFFHREDILWFKPIQLRTKYGRRGHIREPLGTHGHMKCVFDGQLKSQDTILMNLYKRVFPKWTFEPCLLPF